MNTKNIEKLVDETINCMDGASRAEPAPYLLTRINAKMGMQPLSAWERVSALLGRPGVAFGLVIFLVIINLFIHGYGNSFDRATMQGTQVSADEYSMSGSSAIFDLENIQP
jgi:hypothetical protein